MPEDEEEYRLDKTAFSVAKLGDEPDERATGILKHPKNACGRANFSARNFMATTLLPSDFKEFLKLLNSNRVEYLLVGGYAVVYHGYTRTTGDIDIWIAVSPTNAEHVVRALETFGFGSVVSTEMFLDKGRMFRMGMPPVRIKLLTEISGLDFATCYARRIETTLDGVDVNVVSLADLKANKVASGRPKDIADLENLP